MPWRWVSSRLTFDHKWLDDFGRRRDRSPAKEMNQRPLKNGRLLSPDSERGRRGRRRAVCGRCRTRYVSTHCQEYSDSAMIVDTNLSPLSNSNVTEMRE